ncbi:MAG: DNA primase [Candidatus Omnitrophica bacterium]|nr:DNA primase [Candidatus Omnitrophota bacterium]
MIPQSFIEEVQSRTDIADIIGGYIDLKRAGRNFKAVCPFHSEKTPSFMVSSQKQIFHCFGCGEGGGVFQFLVLMEKITFPEAVEMLAEKLGLTVPNEGGSNNKSKSVLYDVMTEGSNFFYNNLTASKNYPNIINYLNKRGIDNTTITKFKLGYVDDNNILLSYMRGKGVTLENLEKVSLVISKHNGFRDLFVNRIMFPIFDIRSRVVGFGARTIKAEPNSPKYINSIENFLYSKRDHLFGLNFAKDDISKEDSVIVVEGYLDMIIPYVNGIKNIVASLGTALTIEQIRLIKRYTSNVILSYDSDEPGRKATLRSIDLLVENDLKVKVVELPEGYDPDSLVIEKGKDRFLQKLNEKQDFFDYKLDSIKKNYDSKSIEGKSHIAKEMLTTIDKISSEIEKYEYIRKLASALNVKDKIMIDEYKILFSKKGSFYKKSYVSNFENDSSKERINSIKEPLSVTEKVILKSMLTNYNAFIVIKKNLKEEYFSSHLARKTVEFFFNHYPEGLKHSPSDLLGAVKDKEISSFISRIIMDEDIFLDKDVFKQSLLKLCKKGVEKIKVGLKEQIREAEGKGDKNKLKKLIMEFNRVNSEVRNG